MNKERNTHRPGFTSTPEAETQPANGRYPAIRSAALARLSAGVVPKRTVDSDSMEIDNVVFLGEK